MTSLPPDNRAAPADDVPGYGPFHYLSAPNAPLYRRVMR